METDPSFPPIQVTSTTVDLTILTAEVLLTVTVAVCVQRLASVTVTVYTPAPRLLATEPVPPVGAHAYPYPPAPPLATTVAEPSVAPQSAGVEFVANPIPEA